MKIKLSRLTTSVFCTVLIMLLAFTPSLSLSAAANTAQNAESVVIDAPLPIKNEIAAESFP
ncbi:MAG: hypothetical protein LBR74_04185, partial [Eubacterium sp.]|nr:hypothetical protein [Eubacterium sp.]